MSESEPTPRRRHRRAVGPAGAHPPVDEPRAEPSPEAREDGGERDDDERFLADVPPHHGPV
jgi:hypothetical protein